MDKLKNMQNEIIYKLFVEIIKEHLIVIGIN